MINRRILGRLLASLAVAMSFAAPFTAHAADEAPDVFIRRVSDETLKAIKSDSTLKKGDLERVMSFVDSNIIPNVDFKRMTAAAVGPKWREATEQQKTALQDQFKTLLVRTYAGALSQVSDQSVIVKPLRMAPEDKEVVVRTEVTGRGEPIQLDYRLEKTPGDGSGWKIYNLNVLGVWLVETYRTQFAQEISAKGLQGLIDTLVARNKTNANNAQKS